MLEVISLKSSLLRVLDFATAADRAVFEAPPRLRWLCLLSCEGYMYGLQILCLGLEVWASLSCVSRTRTAHMVWNAHRSIIDSARPSCCLISCMRNSSLAIFGGVHEHRVFVYR
ncbi:unnamed protein product [Amoebophrya sp. A120]|nr:unnamed protein product [Amoebophrya sp. A120]|eukprot:GSA120T00025669001.1